MLQKRCSSFAIIPASGMLNKMAKWLRTRFFEHDPKAYREQLVADLVSCVHDASLLRETIADLAERYPGQAQSEIRRMLAHADPEVAVDAAFVLLSNHADDREALAVLDNLAGNIGTGIPSHVDWFDRFARTVWLGYRSRRMSPKALVGMPVASADSWQSPANMAAWSMSCSANLTFSRLRPATRK